MQNCYFPSVKAPKFPPAEAIQLPKTKNVSSKKAVDQISATSSFRADRIRKSCDEMRKTFMKVGVVHGASGSAYVEFHQTKVVCAVYGPRSDTRSRREFSDEGQLVCDFKYAPFADRNGRRERGQDPDELEMSSLLEQSLSAAVLLHKLPKCVVSIYIVVLENDGSALAAAINCASLALADAAIEMYDVVVASSVAVIKDQVLLDPSLEEEEQAEGTVTLALLPTTNRVTHIVQKGRMQHLQLQESVDLLSDANTSLLSTMLKTALAQRFGASK